MNIGIILICAVAALSPVAVMVVIFVAVNITDCVYKCIDDCRHKDEDLMENFRGNKEYVQLV